MINHIINFIVITIVTLLQRAVLFFIGLFVQIPIVAWIKYQMKTGVAPIPNVYGESTQDHTKEYIALGASGFWQYWDAPKWLSWFGNLEDGYLQEPSGKGSARCKGKERDFLQMYLWSAIRNPVNTWSRTNSLTTCYPERCIIQYKGTASVLSDNDPVLEGWHFVWAIDTETAGIYYGFRLVHQWKRNYLTTKLKLAGKVARMRIGTKIKPNHANATFDEDDRAKGWTFRASLATDPES